jgi:predicted phosphodiesterase
MRPKLILTFLIVGAIFFLSGCESRVSNPNQRNLDENSTNLTQKNLEKISKIKLEDPYKFNFAIVSDTHVDYGDFRDIIKDINEKSKPSFLIHAGDFTYLGLPTEFAGTNYVLNELTVPFLTVIGNHECYSNGRQFYKKIFGDFNYSFAFNDYKFIFLDGNIWENGGKPPDFDWLEGELSQRESYNHVFVIVHIPPFDISWSDEIEDRYKQLMAENNVSLSIHGHTHSFWYGERYDDGVKYLVVDDAADRNYCIVSVDSAAFDVQKINIDR